MKKFILILTIVSGINNSTVAQRKDLPVIKTGYSGRANIAMLQGNTFISGHNPAYDNSPKKDYDYYNRKSRNLRITGLSLLGAGLVLGLSGLLVASNDNYTDSEGRDRTIRTLFVLSAATGIASIPLMVLAHVNKTKARTSLSSQKTSFGIPGKTEKNIIGLTLSIPVGK